MLGSFGLPEIGIIVGLGILLFAPKKFGQSLSGLANGLKDFRNTLREPSKQIKEKS
jgi:Sec-independent protein translocase protein TatA